jgi:hypothetical protein
MISFFHFLLNFLSGALGCKCKMVHFFRKEGMTGQTDGWSIVRAYILFICGGKLWHQFPFPPVVYEGFSCSTPWSTLIIFCLSVHVCIIILMGNPMGILTGISLWLWFTLC